MSMTQLFSVPAPGRHLAPPTSKEPIIGLAKIMVRCTASQGILFVQREPESFQSQPIADMRSNWTNESIFPIRPALEMQYESPFTKGLSLTDCLTT